MIQFPIENQIVQFAFEMCGLNFDQITYWTSHRENCPPNESNSDISALKNNTISISPIYPKFSYETEPNINFNLQKK